MLSQPNEPLRIAFVGKAKVGRTYCAEYLRVQHKFVRMNLSDPINRFLKTLYFFDRNARLPWETKRSFYDSLYKLDKDLLVNYLIGRVKVSPSNIVVDDVRYTSEALRLKEMDFKIVRVTRPKGKEIHLTKALGKIAEPGTLLLNEMYNKDFTLDLGVDYSLHNDTKENTKRALDDILSNILTNRT